MLFLLYVSLGIVLNQFATHHHPLYGCDLLTHFLLLLCRILMMSYCLLREGTIFGGKNRKENAQHTKQD
jgi:hypothetical protein